MKSTKNCGGILAYGIPEFRLPRDILEKTINKITSIPGIKVETNKELGKDFNLQELSNNYDAVFLAIGSNISSKMNIEGEELEGVYGANELLENKVFPNFLGRKNIIVLSNKFSIFSIYIVLSTYNLSSLTISS